jgi:hypothetical protein
LFLPLPIWVAIVVLLVLAGLAGARVIEQVTSTSEVVEPLRVTDKVDFDTPLWPCTSTFLTFNVVNDAPVTYGLRLTPGECIFPEGVHFGEVTVSGEPYTWGETVEIPPYGTVACSIEVVADCDAEVGPVKVTINVERVAPGPPTFPTIGYSPSSFSFEAEEGGANPSDQTLGIWNAGAETLNWSVSDDGAWLSLSPTSGSSTGETDDVTLSVDISGMSADTYTATITITAPGATNTPQTVPVSLTIAPGWWVFDYETAEIYLSIYTSVDGGIPDLEIRPAIVSGCELWVSTGITEGSSAYRVLKIPQASYWSVALVSEEADPTLGWSTILLVMTGDGDGRLYIDAWGDVDVAGETTEIGTALTWGDGDPDPPGSAWLHLPLRADIYCAPGVNPKPDPGDPSTWGMLGLQVPMDIYMTTGVSENHITDTAEPATPATALTCSTKIDAGVPFAIGDGDPADYVGTGATLVAASAVIDQMFGEFEIDIQFISATEIAPAAP